MTQLIRAFSSMFLSEPHRATRDYSGLLKLVGKDIFVPSHRLEPYYTSAFAHYRQEFLFRNYQLDLKFKPARYHMLMVLRHQRAGKDIPRLNSHELVRYCQKILDVLWDDQTSINAFNSAAEIIEKVCNGIFDRDVIRTQHFTNQLLIELNSSSNQI